MIVPVLDEAEILPELLDGLAALTGDPEVVVCDGGSTDESPAIVARHPVDAVRVLEQRGRARQCNAGAAEASGDALLFLHADTLLPAGAVASIERALSDPAVVGGNFALRFGGSDRFSRTLTHWYALQRRGGIFYGDSAIWMRREVFERLGGFAALPIMEDYDLVRRLGGAGRTVCLPGPAVTSSRRWQRLGLARTLFSWVVIRWLYLAGVSPARLARLYPKAR